MAIFKKTRECPSSWDLYHVTLYGARRQSDRELVRHTVECDFCAAELDLYYLFPLGEIIEVEAPPMPAALRELADSVLTSQAVVSARLDALLGI
ncbi:MAG: hypothetical protein ACK4S4_08005 [Pyrinomonadaceae bacterium]